MLPRCEAWQFSLIKLIHCFTSHRTLFNEVKNIVLYLAVISTQNNFSHIILHSCTILYNQLIDS